jgi:hypothetical protein
MIFRVYEHYHDNEEIINDNEVVKECFICFETIINNNEIPLNLQCQEIYLTLCKCDGKVHKTCLDVWFNKSKKCPICRISVGKIIISNHIFFRNCLLIYHYYLYLFNILFKTTRVTVICFVIYYGLQLYFTINRITDYSYY